MKDTEADIADYRAEVRRLNDWLYLSAFDRKMVNQRLQQQATPLEVVRSAYREPTAVLAAAGVRPIVRDEFDERAWPDDIYGLVPRTLGDLGDPELAPLHLAWGMAKATVIRARRAV